MPPFPLEITAGDFAFAAGHRGNAISFVSAAAPQSTTGPRGFGLGHVGRRLFELLRQSLVPRGNSPHAFPSARIVEGVGSSEDSLGAFRTSVASDRNLSACDIAQSSYRGGATSRQ
jgi:hypothetical protein